VAAGAGGRWGWWPRGLVAAGAGGRWGWWPLVACRGWWPLRAARSPLAGSRQPSPPAPSPQRFFRVELGVVSRHFTTFSRNWSSNETRNCGPSHARRVDGCRARSPARTGRGAEPDACRTAGADGTCGRRNGPRLHATRSNALRPAPRSYQPFLISRQHRRSRVFRQSANAWLNGSNGGVP